MITDDVQDIDRLPLSWSSSLIYSNWFQVAGLAPEKVIHEPQGDVRIDYINRDNSTIEVRKMPNAPLIMENEMVMPLPPKNAFNVVYAICRRDCNGRGGVKIKSESPDVIRYKQRAAIECASARFKI